MVDFDTICELAAMSLGCEYIYGDKEQVELYIEGKDLINTNGLIMLAPIEVTGTYINGVLQYSTYPLSIGIGRRGVLEESYQNKSRLQLKQMIELIENLMKLIGGCSTDVTIKDHRIYTEVNRFSDNLDCVFASITLTDE